MFFLTIPKLHGNFTPRTAAVVICSVLKTEKLLLQTIVLLFLPFRGQEGHDLVSAFDEEVPVAPDAVGRVALGDLLWVARIPHGLGKFELLACRLFCERWCYRRHCGRAKEA